MQFQLVDQVLEVQPTRRLVAIKNLTLGEEYLADHFPTFPVLPGVLMLEALVQCAAWLLRASDDFAHSVIVLREAKGVKYGSFVAPGTQLRLSVEVAGPYDAAAKVVNFKGQGESAGVSNVNARFSVERYNLAERNPKLAGVDQELVRNYRQQWAVLA
jgi:3-hydroxyacyl-[acyl-carrier-protein] dehydratase